jgi:hypothetical protein
MVLEGDGDFEKFKWLSFWFGCLFFAFLFSEF